jgi:hypothetical protein
MMATTTVSTRATSKLALTHVLDNVIQRLRISNAFKKYEEITDLLQLDDATISNLEYDTMVNNITTMHPLQQGDMGMIRSFIHYIRHCSSIYDPIGNDWLSITDNMLDEFRTDLTQIYKFNYIDSIHTTPPSATPSPLSAATISSSLLSQFPVDLFKRGIKRNFNAFPTLKDEKYNDQWHRTFTNMACAQDLSDVLHPQYVLQTTTAHDLFWEKQKFLYAVLKTKVETAKGKSIIRQYESMYDAQKSYKDLEEHHLTSNTAMFALIRLWNTS